MNLSCIIIEDEPLATEKLESYISKTPLQHKASFDNALDGLQYLQNHTVDILFLDIQMEELTGIQMLESSVIKPYVIITSAYSEYALKGYELKVFDYLLKPFGFDRFLKAVNKVQEDIKSKIGSQKQHLIVKAEYKLEQVKFDDILYIEGMKEYLRIVLPERKIMTKESFKNLLKKLPSNQFMQVHKSWAVNLHKINTIERNRIHITDKIIPIGRSFQTTFNERMKI